MCILIGKWSIFVLAWSKLFSAADSLQQTSPTMRTHCLSWSMFIENCMLVFIHPLWVWRMVDEMPEVWKMQQNDVVTTKCIDDEMIHQHAFLADMVIITETLCKQLHAPAVHLELKNILLFNTLGPLQRTSSPDAQRLGWGWASSCESEIAQKRRCLNQQLWTAVKPRWKWSFRS